MQDQSPIGSSVATQVSGIMVRMATMIDDLAHQNLATQTALTAVLQGAPKDKIDIKKLQVLDRKAQCLFELGKLQNFLANAIVSESLDAEWISQQMNLEEIRSAIANQPTEHCSERTQSGDLVLF